MVLPIQMILPWNEVYNGDLSQWFFNSTGDNPTYSLGDYVWLDKNKNGVQDDDEKGLAGVYVTLKDSNNRELQRVTTDQSGHYQFDNLQNGTYTVEFAIPDNYTPSPANNSTNDAIDSDGERDGTRKVVVAKGTINNADNMTVDTGFYLTPKYNVGDYVWEDTNKDGIQDDNEKGISGVKVTLKIKWRYYWHNDNRFKW